jgi:hypothetical protein
MTPQPIPAPISMTLLIQTLARSACSLALLADSASQKRGGLPNPAFTDADRQKAFDLIAVFFQHKFSQP